jgi:hypothetical protein
MDIHNGSTIHKLEIEETDEDLVYHEVESIQSESGGNEEMILAHEVSDMAFDLVDIVEVAEIDRNNLPRKLQTSQKGEKQKVVKTRSIQSVNEPYPIVQLGNIRLFQCDICSRTFKEKSKLKAHKEIHTTERKVVCPVSLKISKKTTDFNFNLFFRLAEKLSRLQPA